MVSRGSLMLWEQQNEKLIIRYEDFPYMTYVRVSTDKDEQASSPENQIDICRYWLEQHHFEWNENSVVFDDGISGTILLERKAMQLILKKARRREIKMVVFKSIHRLARDLKDALEIKETLLAHGVRLVTIEEGYDSLREGKNDMKFEMFAMFAAQQPKTISVSISSAMAAKARRGERVGKVPFGYKVVDKKMVINEDEAPTVRKIFKWYNEDGLGFKNITHKLNEELLLGNVAPPRTSDKWQLTSVQTMIRNPAYAGIFIYNRYTTTKIGGRKKQIQNPREKWVIYENHHPAIISKAEWEKANRKEVLNKKTKITPWNEFRGLLRCSECGSNMIILQAWKKKDDTRTIWRYLKCSAYRRAGKHGCINHKPMRYEDFRDFMLKRLIQKGKTVSLNFKNTVLNKKEKEINAIEKRIVQLEEMNKNLIDLYIEEKLITKLEFLQKRKSYQDEMNRLKERLFVLKQDEESEINIENIQVAFEQLEKKDEDLHYAFKTLIDHIVVYPDGKVDIHYMFEE